MELLLKEYHMHLPIRANLMGRKRAGVIYFFFRGFQAEMLALFKDEGQYINSN